MRSPRRNSFLVALLLLWSVFAGNLFAQGPIKVDLKKGTVKLIAEDRTFGEVLDAIAQEANFTTKITPELSSRKISIRLYDVSLERAITRLFSLVQMKNYSVEYHSSGGIMHVEEIKVEEVKSPVRDRNLLQKAKQRRNTRQDRSQKYTPKNVQPRKYRPQYVRPDEPGIPVPQDPDDELPEKE